MKSKKKLLSFMLAVCLILPAMLVLTACGSNNPPAPPEISEKGRTYAVVNATTDLEFNWANAEEQEYFTTSISVEAYKTDSATTKVSFDHKGQITLNLPNETETKTFYSVGADKKVSFYSDNAHTTQLGKMDASIYGYNYQFNNTKEKLTVAVVLPGCAESTINITLTAGPELIKPGVEYMVDGNEITINWKQSELTALGEEYNLQTREEIECEYISEEFNGGGYSVLTTTDEGLLLVNFGRYEILSNGTIQIYDYVTEILKTDIICTINADRTQIILTMPILEGFTSTITAVYNLAD